MLKIAVVCLSYPYEEAKKLAFYHEKHEGKIKVGPSFHSRHKTPRAGRMTSYTPQWSF